MAERIIVEFLAEVDQYQKEIDEAIESTEDLEKAAVKGADKSEDAYKAAARKRSQLIEKEKKLLKELRRNQKLAFDPKTIDTYNRKIRESETRLKSLTNVGKKAGAGLSSVFGRVAGGLGVAAAGAGVVALGNKAIKAAADYEKLQVSFNTFLGSAEKGQKVLDELDKFSLKTPFEPEQVFQAGKALLAFGIEQENLIETLERIGDVSSATGKDFNELSVIYGKARVQGTLFSEDINQLTEAGVPIIQEFAKQFGVTEGEVKKLGSQGKITFDNLEEGFRSLTSEGGKFFGLTNRLSTTTAGKLSTLSGKMTELARTVGQQLAPAFNAVLDVLIGTGDELDNATQSISTAADDLARFEQTLEPLAEEYDTLTAKTELSADEQERLKEVIAGIADEIPSAVTAYDELGNAIEINTEAVKLYGQALQENLKLANEDKLRILNERLAEAQEEFNTKLAALNDNLERSAESFIRVGTAGEASFTNLNQDLRFTDAELKKIQDRLDKLGGEDRTGETTGIIATLREQIAQLSGTTTTKSADAAAEDARTAQLKISELQNKSLEELRAIRAEQEKINDATAKKNIDLIDTQIKALEKLQKAAEKAAEEARKQAEAAAKFIKEQNKLDFEAEEAERAEDQATTDALNAELEKREKAEKAYRKNIADFERQQQLAEVAGRGITDRVRFAQAELAAMAIVRDQEVEQITEKQKDGEIAYLEGESKKTDILRKEIEERAKLLQAIGVTEADLLRTGVDLWLERNEEILSSSFELFGALTDLQAAQTQRQLEEVEKRREIDNQYFQSELDNLENLKEQRRITEDDYQKKREEINSAQLASEKRLEKETAKIRQREAVAQKAQALFQIALHTAEAIAEASPDPFRIALAIAIGAAQAAAAASTPIPKFAKGTKASPEGLALVGEEGPELVHLPRNSKVLPADKTMRHSELIEAMRDNRLEEFLHREYLAPELIKQQERLRIERETITRERVAGGLNYYDLLDANKKGSKVRNVNELAQAIARAIKENETWQ